MMLCPLNTRLIKIKAWPSYLPLTVSSKKIGAIEQFPHERDVAPNSYRKMNKNDKEKWPKSVLVGTYVGWWVPDNSLSK